MAAEPWNRVNIPFPGAVSSVRIHFSSKTDTNIKKLLAENERVLKLIRSEILQTEIRVLYELLYNLNNSFRGNKTFKSLQQVEQCINRLKNMKLDVALEDLTDLCPNRIRRELGVKDGECDVPSQPMLEWLCLKVLGAAQLMSCTLNRCSKAFILSKQQMKWEEFVILNVVITSMLSRLWVIFRGVLYSLTTLYQQLLKFLREVAHAQSMPFLTDFSLPEDIVHFLGPSAASVLVKRLQHDSHGKVLGKQRQKQKKKSTVKVKSQAQTKKFKEDLGVAIERDIIHDTALKPFLKVFGNFTEGISLPRGTHKADKMQKFKKQVRKTTTFTDMAAHLDEMIIWCKSQRMKKEKHLLTFLRLKCHKMKCLEAAGCNVQRKLQIFRQEACWASCPQGSVPKTCRFAAATRRTARLRTRLVTLRSRIESKVKNHIRRERLKKRRRRSELSTPGLSKDTGQRHKTTQKTPPQTTDCDNHDDIDDIFASIGL